MTLPRKHDGRIDGQKITLICTLIGAAAAIVMAIQPAVDATRKFVAPWVEMPGAIAHHDQRLEAIQKQLKRIEAKLDIVEIGNVEMTSLNITNSQFAKRK